MISNKVVGGRINLRIIVEIQVLRDLEHGPTPEARPSMVLQHSVINLGRQYTNHAFKNVSCMLITWWGQIDLIPMISHEA